VTVNIDDFTRTRDSVIVSLATLQSAVSDLSRAYINHANTVLNRGPSTLDLGPITSSLLENGLLGGGRVLSPGARSDGEVKKKRKRAPHDPNAPKRALTPYFLYMQHNRSAIASELGSSARPKEVADEGTRRWAEMPEAEKQIWKSLYAENLAVYKERMKAYKAGLPMPEDDTTEAASKQLQQSVHLATEEASSDESEEEVEEEQEEASPEPVKEPTPPRSGKRRRATGDRNAVVPSPVAPKKASPDKRKRSAGAKKDAEEKSKRAAAETPKTASEKRAKKKRRSEAVDDD